MDDDKFLECFEWFGTRNFRIVGPVDQSDHALLRWLMADFLCRTVSTIWHYHGDCVVERVVDGSTFSISPVTNPQVTLMMLGR